MDCAGAVMGGALRFLQELDGYLGRRADGTRTIGRARRVSGPWLAERELRAWRSGHTVALNNVTFAHAGRFKTVLLRNALHFLSDEERTFVAVGRGLRAQTAVVHRLLGRADRIVVPTSSMAARVVSIHPRAAGRIRVMHHPVSLPPRRVDRENVILCPVLDAPYKVLGPRIAELLAAMNKVRREGPLGGPDLELTLTPQQADSLRLRLPGWVRLLGRLTPSELYEAQQSARAIVYPTTIESFGFPLAEARLGSYPLSDEVVDPG